MPADPKGLAARPAFLALLDALRGGHGPCPRCKGETKPWCGVCWGSGRVAVPPDPRAALYLRDWWEEGGKPNGSDGGDLAGLLVVYARLTEKCGGCQGKGVRLNRIFPHRRRCDTCRGSGELPDPAMGLVLAAWDEALCPARAAAVRGLRLERRGAGWYVLTEPGPRRPDGAWQRGGWCPAEPAARLALKAAVLRCFDPGNPYDGGAGVRIPCPNCGAGTFLPRRKGPDGVIDCCDGSGWIPPSSLLPAAGADAGDAERERRAERAWLDEEPLF